jgi:hypothetical protein
MAIYRPTFDLLDDTTLQVYPGMYERAIAEWKALLEWCRAHGLDPHAMPAQQVIYRDVERCRVVYDRYVLDHQGHVQRDPRSNDPSVPWIFRNLAQGETPPLPFPDVILRHLDRTETE